MVITASALLSSARTKPGGYGATTTAGIIRTSALVRGERTIAIGVELHSKSNARLLTILRGYESKTSAGRLEFVGYVWTRAAVVKAVHRQARAAHIRRPAIRFASLDDIIGRTRQNAAELKAPESQP